MKTRTKIILISITLFAMVASAPFLVFVFVHKPSLIEGAGTEDTWVSFWGSFLGGIISASLTAMVSYSILYRQQKENKKTIEYQIAIQNYESMKSSCMGLINAIDTNFMVDATNAFLMGKADEARNIVGLEYLKIKAALTKFYIGIETFYYSDNDKADYSDECSALVKRYQSFLDIIQMLMSIAANGKHNDYNTHKIIMLLESAATYDKEMLSRLKCSDERINYEQYSKWVTLSSKILMEYLDDSVKDDSVKDDFSRYLLVRTGDFLRDEKKKIMNIFNS